MKWKFCLAFLLVSLLLSPVFSESNTDLEIEIIIPDLIPTEEYIMLGQDILTLYQTIKDSNESKNGYKSLLDETMITLKDVTTLSKELEKENQKLTLQNNFLIGTTVVSVGIVVTGVIVWAITN